MSHDKLKKQQLSRREIDPATGPLVPRVAVVPGLPHAADVVKAGQAQFARKHIARHEVDPYLDFQVVVQEVRPGKPVLAVSPKVLLAAQEKGLVKRGLAGGDASAHPVRQHDDRPGIEVLVDRYLRDELRKRPRIAVQPFISLQTGIDVYARRGEERPVAGVVVEAEQQTGKA